MDSFLFFLTYVLFATLYAAAFVIALSFWRRCRTACALMLASTSVLLVAIAARAYLQFRLLNGDFNLAAPAVVFTGLSLVQWIGHALMIAAVFANRGRQANQPRWPKGPYAQDDDWDDPPFEPRPGNTGIKNRDQAPG